MAASVDPLYTFGWYARVPIDGEQNGEYKFLTMATLKNLGDTWCVHDSICALLPGPSRDAHGFVQRIHDVLWTIRQKPDLRRPSQPSVFHVNNGRGTSLPCMVYVRGGAPVMESIKRADQYRNSYLNTVWHQCTRITSQDDIQSSPTIVDGLGVPENVPHFHAMFCMQLHRHAGRNRGIRIGLLYHNDTWDTDVVQKEHAVTADNRAYFLDDGRTIHEQQVLHVFRGAPQPVQPGRIVAGRNDAVVRVNRGRRSVIDNDGAASFLPFIDVVRPPYAYTPWYVGGNATNSGHMWFRDTDLSLDFPGRVEALRGVWAGLRYLHTSLGILHGDVKAANIFLSLRPNADTGQWSFIGVLGDMDDIIDRDRCDTHNSGVYNPTTRFYGAPFAHCDRRRSRLCFLIKNNTATWDQVALLLTTAESLVPSSEATRWPDWWEFCNTQRVNEWWGQRRGPDGLPANADIWTVGVYHAYVDAMSAALPRCIQELGRRERMQDAARIMEPLWELLRTLEAPVATLDHMWNYDVIHHRVISTLAVPLSLQ